MTPSRTPLNTPALRTRLVCALLAAASLSACAPLVLGTAVGGALVASDRRTSGAQVEDKAIELKASNRLGDAFGGRAHINVNAYNRMVLLTGEVPAEPDRLTAEQIASRVENAGTVVNQLVVATNSTLGSRSNDVLLAGKVRATLVDARDVISGAFDIVVERGEVYLMGIVSEREANRAAELTASIDGVKKVVKVFQVISEDELAKRQPKPVSSEPVSAPASPR
ncbi:BON domain-containing protein [uncultured Aquabacterium sp.]|jgi:osmotically-inducible protein OsmY|uniref:BON domain-containing protein n=1 Tax=Aquabacterium commune TaxID=70586 RepID=UPI0030D08F65